MILKETSLFLQWQQFLLKRDSNGNAKIIEGANSDCTTGIPVNYQKAMCGEIKLNS